LWRAENFNRLNTSYIWGSKLLMIGKRNKPK